ncbi:THUMP domain-containing protein 1 isoform X1 [Tripterygium wilfordii]|uniref:THUMP domain-containing protein 1 isoform X1 n=1 Tax=Tripterygium wilfordii TaxID=458696 RepID=A0A7J7C9K5_TRIWF|nr:THUMP domain-containing protein 1 homolog [Tripterygium wilfordii]KAF5730844.1 THUMP domain-containing protein 1 isoform X1 [Tripterygium wilfordii]
MAGENKSSKDKKRKQYLPYNKPVKKKGAYPLHPGVQGFFITCDGGRERQASREAINIIDSFYEELVDGKGSNVKLEESSNKPLNKKIKFSYSDDDSDGSEVEEGEKEGEGGKTKSKSDACENNDASLENLADGKADIHGLNDACHGNQTEEEVKNKESTLKPKNEQSAADGPPIKKQCLEAGISKCGSVHDKVEFKSIDKLIEEELKELGDKSKRRFVNLDSGCNGVVFVQMQRNNGDPSPKDIVQHMMTSAASSRKHMSRFILRVLPVEVACYSSEGEISKAMETLVGHYFPVETENPHKFAVLYEARANSGIDRMKIINSVAKSVPGPHKVDLSNPDVTIIVQIVKTVCLIGVVDKYKELSKYNLRQLTSAKQ